MRKILLIALLAIGCSKSDAPKPTMYPHDNWEITKYREYDENGNIITDSKWILTSISFGDGSGPVTANKGVDEVYKGTFWSSGDTISIKFTDHPELNINGKTKYGAYDNADISILTIRSSADKNSIKEWRLEQPIKARNITSK